jgi:hypothetical protein
MELLIDGEVIDTYGGDFTYRDVEFELENGEYSFYETNYGAKPVKRFLIDDIGEIAYLMSIL